MLFFVLLFGLPLLARSGRRQPIALFEAFYRSGALVFGGGHVVLPLLQAEVVPPGWVANDAFLAGYGAAQAVPGPLFTFAAYLGAVVGPAPNGWVGGLIAWSRSSCRLPAADRRAAVLGRAARGRPRRRRCSGSTRPSSGCCWRRCTAGVDQRDLGPPISPSRSPFCCSHYGRCRHGWWCWRLPQPAPCRD